MNLTEPSSPPALRNWGFGPPHTAQRHHVDRPQNGRKELPRANTQHRRWAYERIRPRRYWAQGWPRVPDNPSSVRRGNRRVYHEDPSEPKGLGGTGRAQRAVRGRSGDDLQCPGWADRQ